LCDIFSMNIQVKDTLLQCVVIYYVIDPQKISVNGKILLSLFMSATKKRPSYTRRPLFTCKIFFETTE